MSIVTTFRSDAETRRIIRELRRRVQPTRFNARRASASDVIRASLKTMYAQQIADQQNTKSEGNHEKTLAA